MKLKLIFSFLLLTQILSAQSFTEVMGTPFEGVLQSYISFADVDGDNEQDVLITGRNNLGDYIAKLYTNDGTGNFSEAMGIPFEGFDVSSFAFADVDGDNDQDLLITGRSALPTQAFISTLFINDGMGNFSEAMGTPFEPVDNSSIAFADVDGDNDQDVLITGSPISGVYIAKLYINDGVGNFSEPMGTSFEGVILSTLAFADVDGDNDQDVLISGRIFSGTFISKLYTNDGLGNFSEAIGTPFEGITSGSLAFADVDGDNDQDVLITGRPHSGAYISKLYTNDGMGNFSEAMGTPFEPVYLSNIAFADVNGNNFQDVLITGRPNGGAWISTLYTNDGMGNFSEAMDFLFEGVETGSIAFADVDGDNDQDVLITGRNNSGVPISKLYSNDGTSSTVDLILGFSLKFTLYPNPVSAINLNVNYDSEINDFVTVKLFDFNGLFLSQQSQFVVIGQNNFIVNIASLIPGKYIIELNDSQRKGIATFTVQ